MHSPSALTAFLACQHLTALELAVARGEVARPTADDPQAELIRRKGDEHERAYLDELSRRGLERPEIELATSDWERAAAETADALARGVDVVYQGVFVHDGWRGIADFLERQPDGSYEVADTKLARTSKPYHILQLCFYTEQLARMPGASPPSCTSCSGPGVRDSYRPGDFMAYYRRVRQRFLEFVADPPETYPLPVSHCQICDFRERCEAQWERDDHLTLVARLGRNQVPRLNDAGITTLAQLATAPPDTEVRADDARAPSRRCAQQAELQLRRPHDRRATLPPARAGAEARASSCCRSPRRATSSSTSRATRSGRPTAGSSTCSASSGARTAARASAPSGRTTARARSARSSSSSTSSTSGCAPTRPCTSTTTPSTSRPCSSG